MKFMIKELGWDRWVRGVHDARSTRAGTTASRCSRSIAGHRVAARLEARRCAARRTRSACGSPARLRPAPASCPTIVPRAINPGDEAYARWRTTNVQPQKQFGYVDGHGDHSARRLHERADARDRRAGAGLQRRHGARHDGAGSRVPLGANRPMCASCIGVSRPRASGWPRRPRSPTSPAARARSRAGWP